MSAIYIHIPFCKRLCGYCDFFKSFKLNLLGETLEAIERELIEQRDFLSDHRVETIYFGGGTPSLVEPHRIAKLLEVIDSHYDTKELKEVTIEANPDDLSRDYLEALRSAGVNRLSIGIQSFDDDELRYMNRRHSSSQAIEAVRMAQAVGFDNITIDLIFGVDGFDATILRSSIATAISLNVQHISAYHLTIEAGTPFARRVSKGELRLAEESQSEEEYAIIESELSKAGFEHYEISNYSQAGYRSLHNSSYWRGIQYLGVGPAAHSYNGEQRRFVVDSIEEYLQNGAERYSCEVLTPKDRYNEFIMTSLRCCEGVNLELLNKNFKYEFILHFEQSVTVWLSKGELCCQNGHIFIPTSHFLISDSIIESLFIV